MGRYNPFNTTATEPTKYREERPKKEQKEKKARVSRDEYEASIIAEFVAKDIPISDIKLKPREGGGGYNVRTFFDWKEKFVSVSC